MGDLIAFKPAKPAKRSRTALEGPATVIIFTGVRREFAENLERTAAKARKARPLRKNLGGYAKKCKGSSGAGQNR